MEFDFKMEIIQHHINCRFILLLMFSTHLTIIAQCKQNVKQVFLEQFLPKTNAKKVIEDGLLLRKDNYEAPRQASLLMDESDVIGCTVWKQEDEIYAFGDVIVFEGVLFNDGGHYNDRTGLFTCPVTGAYYVSLSARKLDAMPLLLAVTIDGSEIFFAISHNTTNTTSTLHTNSAIITCSANQDISVVATGDGGLNGFVSYSYSLFSILLLKENDATDPLYGFSAHNNQYQTYVSGDVIKFREVLYNDAGSYEPSISRFYCPISGIYFLTTNIRQEANEVVAACCKRSTIAELSLVYSNGWQGVLISNALLFPCVAGDYVEVQAISSGSISGTPLHSTFNIYLVNEQDVSCPSSGNESFVGFTAYKAVTEEVPLGEIVSFETVIFNQGNYYNPVTSIFICEKRGVYFIFVSLTKYLTNPIVVDVKTETGTAFRLEDRGNNPGGSLSNSVIMQCLEGWRIYLQAAEDSWIFGSHLDPRSTMSVYLIAEF